jgi:hypothetical protein
MKTEKRADEFSPSQFLWLDDVCDRFEAAWKAGGDVRIEDYLGTASEPLRSALLRELLLVDLEYRTETGERPDSGEYKARFPWDAKLIEDVFSQPSREVRTGGRQHALASSVGTPSDACSTGPDAEAAECEEGSFELVLEVICGPHKGRTFRFTAHDSFVVGRASSAHFRLPRKDPYFSRYHFMIEANPPRCRLVDLGSTNGTYVNSQRIQVGDLHHGDLVKGGDTVLRVQLTEPGHADSTRTYLPRAAPLDHRKAPPEHPVIPGYQIACELGRGGMGAVYLARRTADGAKLAVKTIRPACAAGDREVRRFLREAQILCTLRHPHIVAFHQMGRAGDLLYIVMEYVPGTDAERLLARQGPLPIRRAVRLACQILDALDHAHRRGFVHRDVKPANLLVSGSEPREVCRLADFGLARVYHDSRMSGLTMLGDRGGTLPYMPPEQITHYREALPPADQYSAAATLYRLLTGHFLYEFDESRHQQQLIKILAEKPVPVRERRPDIPEPLAETIHRALAKDPGKRFPDAAAFREALLPSAAPS